MATIVQDYGPIYGEVVNGTVQGRPNGSVYVPITNTISLSLPAGTTIDKGGTPARVRLSNIYNVVAESQDLASNINVSLYSDAACTTLFGNQYQVAAGQFNVVSNSIWTNVNQPVTGTKYYVRAELMNNGVAVAASNAVEVEGA